MPTRGEKVLKWLAAAGAIVTLAGLGASMMEVGSPVWVPLTAIYGTGVSYGFAEMMRLFQRHRRRCADCLEGTAHRILWWAPRSLLVLVVSVLPVLLLLPMISQTG